MKTHRLLVSMSLLFACADDASEAGGAGSSSGGSADTTAGMTMTVGNTGPMNSSGQEVDSSGGGGESTTDDTPQVDSSGGDDTTSGADSDGTTSGADTDGTTGDPETTSGGMDRGDTTTGESTDDGELTSSSGEPPATDTGEPGGSTSTGDPGGSTDTGITFTTGDCPDIAEGEWANCGAGESCESDVSSCIPVSPDPTEATCMFECEDICDCPPAPGDAPVACEDIVGPGGMLDGENECFLDCQDGTPCPEGQSCVAGTLCAYLDVPVGIPTYGDCVNDPDGVCPDGICIVDMFEATAGVCTEDCDVADDCPAPPDGGTVACEIIAGGLPPQCYLDCADDPCPDGMGCFFDTICLWPVE